MQVLKVLSLIWLSGADIIRDESDGRLEIKQARLIYPDVLKSLNPIYNEIDQWFKSWEGASNPDVTIRKALELYCGWQTNEKMNEWLCADYESLMLLHDWTVALAENGWSDIYEDYRRYENDESNSLKIKFYENAVLYKRQNK